MTVFVVNGRERRDIRKRIVIKLGIRIYKNGRNSEWGRLLVAQILGRLIKCGRPRSVVTQLNRVKEERDVELVDLVQLKEMRLNCFYFLLSPSIRHLNRLLFALTE